MVFKDVDVGFIIETVICGTLAVIVGILHVISIKRATDETSAFVAAQAQSRARARQPVPTPIKPGLVPVSAPVAAPTAVVSTHPSTPVIAPSASTLASVHFHSPPSAPGSAVPSSSSPAAPHMASPMLLTINRTVYNGTGPASTTGAGGIRNTGAGATVPNTTGASGTGPDIGFTYYNRRLGVVLSVVAVIWSIDFTGSFGLYPLPTSSLLTHAFETIVGHTRVWHSVVVNQFVLMILRVRRCIVVIYNHVIMDSFSHSCRISSIVTSVSTVTTTGINISPVTV
jgi:hypothetical protein